MNATGDETPRGVAVVADDDSGMRALMALVLERMSLSVIEAKDGGELTDCLKTGQVLSLVVTDLQMPNGTGLRALKQARRLGLETPVIVVTAFGSDRVHEEALRLGATSVIDKPFSLATFREHVCRALGVPVPADTTRPEFAEDEEED
jgi:CheY-like chemotaxis protein